MDCGGYLAGFVVLDHISTMIKMRRYSLIYDEEDYWTFGIYDLVTICN